MTTDPQQQHSGSQQDRQTSPTRPRGRTNVKRSDSAEEKVCVVAFLVRPKTEKAKAVIDHIQEIRRRYDQAYSRWEPHLTLIPPFIVPFTSGGPSIEKQAKESDNKSGDIVSDQLNDLAASIRSVCNAQMQHVLILDTVSHFALKRYDTLHLLPASSEACAPFLQLQHDIEQAIPQAIKSSRGKSRSSGESFQPHMTLGQAKSAADRQYINETAGHALSQAADGSESLQVAVETIQLMVKPAKRSGPYDIYQEFPLKRPMI